jgi:hypothetical protein
MAFTDFDAVEWHDAEFNEMRLFKDRRGEDCLQIKIHTSLGRQSLIFLEPAVLKVDLDLLGKRFCSDHISTAESSPFSEELMNLWLAGERYEFLLDQDRGGYQMFKIKMIDPGGEIVLLARDLRVYPLTR